MEEQVDIDFFAPDSNVNGKTASLLSFPALSKTETFTVICVHSGKYEAFELKVFH
jgi:hypothetical protein